jgi:hypothetical protein
VPVSQEPGNGRSNSGRIVIVGLLAVPVERLDPLFEQRDFALGLV